MKPQLREGREQSVSQSVSTRKIIRDFEIVVVVVFGLVLVQPCESHDISLFSKRVDFVERLPCFSLVNLQEIFLVPPDLVAQ